MALRWTTKEDSLLLNHYSTEGLAWITENLPGRTKAGIIKRAAILGVKARSWTDTEDYIITACYEQYGAAYCRRYMPRRTEIAIMSRARRIGVLRDRKNHNRDLIESHDHIGCLQAAINSGWLDRPENLPDGFFYLTDTKHSE